MIKNICKKNKCKKAKWLSKEALQIAEKSIVQGKRKKERFSLVTQSCPTLDLMDYSTPGFPIYLQLPGLLKLMSITLVMPSNHLILCHPLLLPSSIFPSIRVFSSESGVVYPSKCRVPKNIKER